MEKSPSSSDHTYMLPIHYGQEGMSRLREMINERWPSGQQVMILMDENTRVHCLPELTGALGIQDGYKLLEIQSGEQHKNLNSCTDLWQQMLQLRVERGALLINLGGGVICDLGGFVASTYKRGIDFVNVPTTLLSQVDASVGGKTGVNLDGQKNQVGLFKNAELTLIHTDFLRTLGERQMKSGFAEMLKHGLVANSAYWSKLKTTDPTDPGESLIRRSIELKHGVVVDDPEEKGLRKLLNFGHTVGHAIEAMGHRPGQAGWLHGEAIAIGMAIESTLSFQKLNLDEESLTEILSTLSQHYNIPVIGEHECSEVMGLMRNDKKNEGGAYRFTLLEKLGQGKIDHEVTDQEFLHAIQYYNHFISSR